LIVLDTSAVVAILFHEPDEAVYSSAIARAFPRLLSAATRVELTFVIEGRKGETGRAALDGFMAEMDAEIVPVTAHHATLAIEAFRKYGKGRHPAALNIGDCFSYSLARATRYPLLFKGNDFAQTDAISALHIWGQRQKPQIVTVTRLSLAPRPVFPSSNRGTLTM